MRLDRWLLVIVFYVSVNAIDLIKMALGFSDMGSQELNLLIAFVCAWCKDGSYE